MGPLEDPARRLDSPTGETSREGHNKERRIDRGRHARQAACDLGNDVVDVTSLLALTAHGDPRLQYRVLSSSKNSCRPTKIQPAIWAVRRHVPVVVGSEAGEDCSHGDFRRFGVAWDQQGRRTRRRPSRRRQQGPARRSREWRRSQTRRSASVSTLTVRALMGGIIPSYLKRASLSLQL